MGGKTVATQSNVLIVKKWFAQVEQAAGPILPDGWFGRPHDSILILESMKEQGEVLVLHFRGNWRLEFEGPLQVNIDNADLVFDSFHKCIFSWKSFESDNTLCRVYLSGQVRLVAPIG